MSWEGNQDMRDGESLRAADAPGRFRSAVALALAAAVNLWVFSQGLALWDRFPERMPVHFGPGGRADGWAAKSVLSVFGPALLLTLLVVLTAFALRCRPKWCNFPGKDRMLALPPEFQEHVVAPIREGTAWTVAGITAMLAIIVRQGWSVAIDQRDGVIAAPLGLLLVAVAILPTIAGVLAARARLRALEEVS